MVCIPQLVDEASLSFLGKVDLPLSVPVAKTNKFILNLNQYRNAHHFTLNKAKVTFKEIVTPRLKALPYIDNALLIYYVYPRTRALSDVANYCSVADKFFSDALVEAGKLSDDNFTVVPEVRYRFGGIDPHNPRVEVYLYSLIDQGNDTMKITLEQNEIEQAIKNYINDQMHIKDGMEIVIELKATRGDTGMTANIDIVKSATEAHPVSSGSAGTVKRVAAVSRVETSAAVQEAVTANKSHAAQEAAAEVGDATEQSTADVGESTEDAAEQETGAAADPQPKKLFAGLSKTRTIPTE